MVRPEPPESWADLPFFTKMDGMGQTPWDQVWGRLESEMAEGRNWQPAPQNIFLALELTPRNAVRVVILGQDPYETEGRATGLAFELASKHASSQSLKGIRAELRRENRNTNLAFPNFPNWAGQGVLLLNTALTVKVGKAASHIGFGWSTLTNEILDAVWQDEQAAFLLWGKHAIDTARNAGVDLGQARVAVSGHPRGGIPPKIENFGQVRRFKASQPFRMVNAWLEARNPPLLPIIWGNAAP